MPQSGWKIPAHWNMPWPKYFCEWVAYHQDALKLFVNVKKLSYAIDSEITADDVIVRFNPKDL